MTMSARLSRAFGPRILVHLALVAAAIAAGLAPFEIYARIAQRWDPAWLDRWSFRATQPPPYRGASYFSPAFIYEASHSVGGLLPVAGTHQLTMPDFSGQWSNVRDGRRVTTNQPSTFRHRLYVFGGSCLFGQEVPDEFTIASDLQRLVNKAMPGEFRVENMGVLAVTTSQELEALKSVRIGQGDQVAFYDGANDVTYSVYYLAPMGLIASRESPTNGQQPRLERLAIEGLTPWKRHSAFVRRLLGRIDLRPPRHLADAATVKILLELTSRQRAAALSEASSIVRGAGGEFFSFLQPDIFDLPVQTSYRESVIRNPLLSPPGLELAFRPAAPVMAAVTASLRAAGVKAANLSGVLTPISASEEVYLDYVHVNHRANLVIAEEIFRQMFRTAWPAMTPGTERTLRAVPDRVDADRLPPPRGRAWDYDFFRQAQSIYAVPKKYGEVWWAGVDVAALPGVVTGATIEEVTRSVRPVPIKTR
jgi:hypothetical protein